MSYLQDRFKLLVSVYLIFRDGDKVLLLKRSNTGYRDGWYSLPAGHINGGEPAIRAAIREAKEEVGVDIDPKRLRLVHTMHRYSEDPEPQEKIDLGFEVSKWRGELRNAEPEKCAGLTWAAVDTLPEKTIPEIRLVLEMIAKGEPYADINFKV
jgi:8-oxo-dGTP diphosphatase